MSAGLKERGGSTPEPPSNGFIPLANVELNGAVSSETVHTAGHELNHALVAFLLGVTIEEITVIPEGNILGKTVFSGSVSDYEMQLIAVSGSIHTHDGTAKGFGSDMFRVHMINRFRNGVDPESAKSSAERILGNFSSDMKEMMAVILAHMGSMSGSQLPDLIARAKIELKRKEQLKERPYSNFVNMLISKPEVREETTDDLLHTENDTKIELTGMKTGTMKAQWVRNGQIIREKTYCTQCGGTEGHFDGCPMVVKIDETSDSEEIRKAKAGERMRLFTHPSSSASQTTS